MIILHTEHVGNLTLTIGQEWEGAGVYWALDCPRERSGALPPYHHRSSGRYYPDQHGETIHGATVTEVLARARADALAFCGAEVQS